MARTKNPLTVAKLVDAAVTFADANGMDALTLRALGDSLGVHHTAIYRHLNTKADLISAMFDWVVEQAAVRADTTTADPRRRIESLVLSFRDVLREHPVLVGTIVSSPGSGRSLAVERVVLGDLRAMGAPEARVAQSYQLLETFVFGAIAFDFAGAPEHLEIRRRRHAESGDEALIAFSAGTRAVEDLNEAAFRRGLDLILDDAVRQRA